MLENKVGARLRENYITPTSGARVFNELLTNNKQTGCTVLHFV